MFKEFLNFSEAAGELATDDEGLRQSLEIGSLKNIPVFLHSGREPFKARLFELVTRSEHDAKSITRVSNLENLPGVPVRSLDGRETVQINDNGLGDDLGDVRRLVADGDGKTSADTFELSGYFRIIDHEVRRVVRERYVSEIDVAPSEWWTGVSPGVGGIASGRPTMHFRVSQFPPEFRSLVELRNLHFRVSDIRASVKKSRTSGSDSDGSIDPRLSTSLLIIIGALAEKAKIDLSQPHKAGEIISAQLQEKGIFLTGRTIAVHLSGVERAMESRKKI